MEESGCKVSVFVSFLRHGVSHVQDVNLKFLGVN